MSPLSPAVSVVIPTYQRAKVLPRSIGSVLAQTWEDFELLVVDDGSSDRTPELLASLEDRRIRTFRQPNRGVAAARNRGVEEARGRLVTFLDSDDEALPNWLEACVAAAEDPGVGIVTGGARVVDAGTQRTQIWLPLPRGPFLGNQTIRYAPPGTLAVRRELFLAVGGYAEALRYAENSELVFRLVPACLERGLGVAVVDRPLVVYHRDPTAWRSSEAAFASIRQAAEYILEHHGERLRTIYPAGYANYRGVAAINAARLGDLPAARRHLISALGVEPKRLGTWFRLALTLVPPLAATFWRRHRGPSTPESHL